MPDNKYPPKETLDYAGLLIRRFGLSDIPHLPDPPDPQPQLPPPKRRGRPKEPVDGQFLKAIAEIISKNTKLWSSNSIAKRMKHRDLRERQLRRKVKEYIDRQTDLLGRTPLELWDKLLGIAPPPKLTRKLLREKAFEHLRHQLRRHKELMAKNR